MAFTRATNLVARVCVCERLWESVTARMSAHGARPSEGGGQEGVLKEVESRAEPRKTRTPRFASAVERRVKKMPKPMVDLKNKQGHVMKAKQVRLLSVAHGAARAAACNIGGEQGQKHGTTPERDCAATRASAAGSPRGLRRLGRGARHRSW